MKALQVFYEGRVQGVGFRWTVKDTAREYEVCGWVRNLDDGRVELQVSAEDESEINAFLENIRKGTLAGNIRKETCHPVPNQPFKGFEIRY